jgi:hypothetical protein
MCTSHILLCLSFCYKHLLHIPNYIRHSYTYTSTTKFFVLCFYSQLIHLHRASSFCTLIFVPFVKMEGVVAKWDEEKVYHKIFKNLFQLILFLLLLLLKLFSLFSQMWRNNLWQRLFAHLKMFLHKVLCGCICMNSSVMNALMLDEVVDELCCCAVFYPNLFKIWDKFKDLKLTVL